MNWGLFASFYEMLDSIPTKAVLRAVEAERRMVKDDLEHKRPVRDPNLISVLTFCDFLTWAVCGIYASMAASPVEHRIFYGEIARCLVESSELPPESGEHFNHRFAPTLKTTGGLLRILITNEQRAKN